MKDVLLKGKKIYFTYIFILLWTFAMMKMFGFYNSPLVALVIFGIGVFFAGKFDGKINGWIVCFSVLIAGSTLVGSKIEIGQSVGYWNIQGDNYVGLWNMNYVTSLKLSDFIWTAILFAGNVLIFHGIIEMIQQKISENLKVTGHQSKHILAICATAIFMCWLPYALKYYPGLIYGDSLASIYQGIGAAQYNNHHPICYTLLIKVFLEIGQLFGSLNLGCFLYTLFQMLMTSITFGCVLSWLNKKGVNLAWIAIFTGIYALIPVFPLHAISMWKDPLFSAGLLLLSLFLYDVVESKGKILDTKKGMIIYILLMWEISMMRNNGIYIMILVTFFLLGLYAIKVKLKQVKKMFTIDSILSLLLIMIITGPVYKSFGWTGEFAETVGIPIQQMASVVVYDGKMNEQDKEFVFQLLPEEKYKEIYTPCCVDNIKWNADFNEQFLEDNKGMFFKTYFSMLSKNFKLYVKAWIMETYGYWTFNDWENNFFDYSLAPFQYPEEIGVVQTDMLYEIFHVQADGLKSTFQFLRSGILTWMILFVGVVLLVVKKRKYLLVLIPCMATFLTLMISVPLADWLRYILVYVYSIPLIFSLPFLVVHGENREDN